jgi:hypothetical protein
VRMSLPSAPERLKSLKHSATTYFNFTDTRTACYEFRIVTCMSDSRRGFGLDIAFIDHLHELEIKSDSPHSQIITAHPKLLPASCVFTSRSLTTASNSGDSSSSFAEIHSERLVQN